jgi:acetamidase/formamidase
MSKVVTGSPRQLYSPPTANFARPDATAVFTPVQRPKGASVHILTGLIYIEGASLGDTFEVRVLDVKFRVPYGVNNTGPGKRRASFAILRDWIEDN